MTSFWKILVFGFASAATTYPAAGQFLFPAAELHGAGSSTIALTFRQAADCYGQNSNLGFGAAVPVTVTPPFFKFDRMIGLPSSTFDCRVRDVQPSVAVRYLATGAGIGTSAWLNGRLPSTIDFPNDFGGGDFDGGDGFQFAMSDVPLSSADINAYTSNLINPFGRFATPRTAREAFGAPIQVPLAIVPIAMAFDPVYKRKTFRGQVLEYAFTIVGGTGTGGLRLTRDSYCKIANGVITNWNQLPSTVVRKDPDDPDAFNVPIELVGRADASGASRIFARALTAQCGNPWPEPGNRFQSLTSDRLPYNGTVLIAGTAYAGIQSVNSGVNAISGARYDKGTDTVSGVPAPGLFTVADGADGVAMYIDRHAFPNPGVEGSVTLNGKIGYSTMEHVLPYVRASGANSYGLFTANLQQTGAALTYYAPGAAGASLAMFGVSPPDAFGGAGAYRLRECFPGQTNLECCPDGQVIDFNGRRLCSYRQLVMAFLREPELKLPTPLRGYPWVGTVNGLFYTCYATAGARQAVHGILATLLGKVARDSTNTPIPIGLFSDSRFGLLAMNGTAPLPAAWRNAITETFLKRSTQSGVPGAPQFSLGNQGLYIQDRLPVTSSGSGLLTAANPDCNGRVGA